jgi:two-component system, NtrC family, sensor histidine kinase HydH
MDINPTFFQDIKQYVGFSTDESAVLASLREMLEPHFPRIAEHFYACILGHPRAHAAITGGRAQVERLKTTLVDWMRSGLAGPHDEEFYAKRARIGRRHVQINLPQQYMVTAMDVMRLDYRGVLEANLKHDIDQFITACNALDRLFDLELAIMFQTYQADSEDKLRRQERLATIGQLAASIGHDLRNPLGVIESSLFIMRRKIEGDEKLTRHLDKIAKQVQICDRIVTDLLDLARNNPPKLASVVLRDAFLEALDQIKRPEDVSVSIEAPPDLSVEADPGLLQQALVNLIMNAIRALQGRGGEVRLRGEQEGETVVISVQDDGPGFDPDILPVAFEPLVSNRAKGIGLGLALVRSVVERHSGEARASNPPSGGARVDLMLPAKAP